ncbi:MAG: sigma-70 family RNA polymerase sigma factor [Bacteroidaceae bacterium]|nr:sigma-70 family RNA polymerase sigma factor [Bacteroidaceae bacterium]
MKFTDQQIIEGLRKGEDWAYAEVFELYYESMCVLANSILQDAFLAEATAQDVISHIFEIREEIAIRTNLRSYLLTSVRNTCLNAISTKTSRMEQTFSTMSKDETQEYLGGTDLTTPQGVLLDNELHKLMDDFIDKLPEPTRTTFIRSRFDGKSYREIGAEQGVSANTVKFRIKNVLKLLEERFGKYLGG